MVWYFAEVAVLLVSFVVVCRVGLKWQYKWLDDRNVVMTLRSVG